MWTVYLIQHDITKQIYIGRTDNFKRRLREHNRNKEKATHRKSGKWLLVYAEVYRSKEDAVKRESRLKHHGSGKHELKKRLKHSLFGTKSGADRSKRISDDCLPKT